MNIVEVFVPWALSWARPRPSPRSSVSARPWPPSIRSSGRGCRTRNGGLNSRPRSMPCSAAGSPAARCMNWPPRRRSSSGPPAALPWRSRPAPAPARAARCCGSRPISPGARAAGPMAPASTCSGLSPARLLVLNVSRPADVLWAMEEGLRCRALACVIAELTGEGAEADLTATRRLSLAAREGVSARVSGLGLLIRHRATPNSTAERGGHALEHRRRAEPARSPGPAERRPRPHALRPFASQEPPRTVRPLARRVGPS